MTRYQKRLNALLEAGFQETGKERIFKVFEKPGMVTKFFLNDNGLLRRGKDLKRSRPCGRLKFPFQGVK